MICRVAILTFACVTAKNVHSANTRDISLPEAKLDFDTSYESSGSLPGYNRDDARSDVSKEIGDFDVHHSSSTNSGRRDQNVNSNERENTQETRQKIDQSNQHHVSNDRKIPRRERRPEVNRENENAGEFHPDNKRNNHEVNRHRHEGNFNRDVNEGIGETSQIPVRNFDSPNSDGNFHNLHRNHGNHQNHRRTDINRGASQDEFITDREEENKRNLNHQIHQNERNLDEIAINNQQYFQSGQHLNQNSHQTNVEDIIRNSPAFIEGYKDHNAQPSNREHHHQNLEHSIVNNRKTNQPTQETVIPHYKIESGVHHDTNNRQSHHEQRFHVGNTAKTTEDQIRNSQEANNNTIRCDYRQSNCHNDTNKNVRVTPKTKADNEVLDVANKDDKWVWGVEKKNVTVSNANSTGVSVEDRASFVGDKCPTGKVKVNNMCVDID